MDKIKNFDELLQDYIGPNKTIVEKSFSNLLGPGENYLSEMKKIHVVLKNKETGAHEELHLVAKCSTEIDFGPTFHTMPNEINFYKYVIPAIQKFQEKHGVPPADFFPKFVEGRLNLTGSDKPDEDAVLVQENLKLQGYEMQDRHVGFDLPTAKAVLKDVATFHSTALALRMLEPETFKADIQDHCKHMPPPPPPTKEDGKHPPGPPNIFPAVLEYVKSNEELLPFLPEFEKFAARQQELMKDPKNFFEGSIKEPFATLLHSDLWINNTMQKIEDGVVIGNKLVDFQMCKLGSPAGDLVFFLTSSIQSHILKAEFDNLIKYYYEIFSNVLKKYRCYGPQFSYENFLEEIKENGYPGISQSLAMLPSVIFTEKGKVFDMSKHNEINFENMPKTAKERIHILFLEATTRGWIF